MTTNKSPKLLPHASRPPQATNNLIQFLRSLLPLPNSLEPFGFSFFIFLLQITESFLLLVLGDTDTREGGYQKFNLLGFKYQVSGELDFGG